MVPVKRTPAWAVKLAFTIVTYVALTYALGLESSWWCIAVALGWGGLVRYLWCAETSDGRYRSARRSMEAGDPRPWQLWRWMDIFGPTANWDRDEELYLRRLYIVRTPWFGVMLHWIKREDWDRDALHDHPWEFWRFIVSGGYTERIAYPTGPAGPRPGEELGIYLAPAKSVVHCRWSFSKYPSGAFHRISSVKPRTVSLVINGPKNNSWGFFVPGTGKIGWRDYVDGAR